MKNFFVCLGLLFSLPTIAANKYWVSYQDQTEFRTSAVMTRSSFLKWRTANLHRLFFELKSDGKFYWLANASLVSLNSDEILALMSDPRILSVNPAGRTAHLVPSIESTDSQTADDSNFTYGLRNIHLPELWRFHPEINGTGVKVGIIDTGAASHHPDLEGKILSFRDFTNKTTSESYDDHGHGSHVAGTIAGGNKSGKFIGVAPEARLVIAKAFDKKGNSNDENLIASLQWMADPDLNPNTFDQPQVVSNSWELDDKADLSAIKPQDEIFCRTLYNLKSLDITPVFAAGNSGPRANTVILPAACPGVLAVGATDQDDRISEFSSRGPVQWLDQLVLKPEVVAPGKGIYSVSHSGGYTTKSGTSMAAPHVAGLLALMKQQGPLLKSEDLERALLASTRDINGNSGADNTFGWGLIEAVEAISKIREATNPRPQKIIGDDNSIPVSGDLSNIPERFKNAADAVGYTNYLCTVTHIGNGYALSAGHCFEAKAYLEKDKSCSFVKVKWGFRENHNPTLQSECEKIVALQNSMDLDFAILKFKSYPKQKAALNLTSPPFFGNEITIFSHLYGGPLQWSQNCLIDFQPHPKIPAGLLKYTCDTEGGSSGAVLFDWNTAEVIGLHKGGWPDMNYGTHLNISPLQEIIRQLDLE